MSLTLHFLSLFFLSPQPLYYPIYLTFLLLQNLEQVFAQSIIPCILLNN